MGDMGGLASQAGVALGTKAVFAHAIRGGTADEAALAMPVFCVRGAKPGPVLLTFAGVCHRLARAPALWTRTLYHASRCLNRSGALLGVHGSHSPTWCLFSFHRAAPCRARPTPQLTFTPTAACLHRCTVTSLSQWPPHTTSTPVTPATHTHTHIDCHANYHANCNGVFVSLQRKYNHCMAWHNHVH